MTTKPSATYDPEADAIGVYFAGESATYASSEEIAPGVTLDFDEQGRVIGVEIAGVRRLVEQRQLPPPTAAAGAPAKASA